jgi:hypothetical protein
VLLCAAAAVLPSTAAAQSRTQVAVGIGDQNASMFSSPAYQALNLKKTRYFIHWDAIDKPGELAKADAFVGAARVSRVSVLMHISTNSFAAGTKLPSVTAYRQKVGALVDRYRPVGVREWGIWNEANHKTQPTFRSPRRAAQFYNAFRGFAGRKCKGCRIVALDLLDQRGVESYIRRWYAAAGARGRSAATYVGIHNYSEVNRKIGSTRAKRPSNRYPGTARIVRAVKRAKRSSRRTQFWYTETGGLAKFGGSFPCNPNSASSIRSAESRQRNRTAYMFTLAKRHRRDIKRLYTYNWQGTNCTTTFDAGVVRSDGATRPAYTTLRAALRRFTK